MSAFGKYHQTFISGQRTTSTTSKHEGDSWRVKNSNMSKGGKYTKMQHVFMWILTSLLGFLGQNGCIYCISLWGSYNLDRNLLYNLDTPHFLLSPWASPKNREAKPSRIHFGGSFEKSKAWPRPAKPRNWWLQLDEQHDSSKSSKHWQLFFAKIARSFRGGHQVIPSSCAVIRRFVFQKFFSCVNAKWTFPKACPLVGVANPRLCCCKATSLLP